MTTAYFVQCGSRKVDDEYSEDELKDVLNGDGKIQAREMYTSSYSVVKRELADIDGDELWILSAKFGLVNENTLIEPYDVSKKDYPLSPEEYPDAPAHTWDGWVEHVLNQIRQNSSDWDNVVILSGKSYLEELAEELPEVATQCDFEVESPFDNPDLNGMGDQMGWCKEQSLTWVSEQFRDVASDVRELPGEGVIQSEVVERVVAKIESDAEEMYSTVSSAREKEISRRVSFAKKRLKKVVGYRGETEYTEETVHVVSGVLLGEFDRKEAKKRIPDPPTQNEQLDSFTEK